MAIISKFTSVPMEDAFKLFPGDLAPSPIMFTKENYRGGNYCVYDDTKPTSPLVVFLGGDGVGLSEVMKDSALNSGYNLVQLFEPDSGAYTNVDVTEPVILASDLFEHERVYGAAREFQNNVRATHIYAQYLYFVEQTITELGLNPDYIVFVGHSRGASSSPRIRELFGRLDTPLKSRVRIWFMLNITFPRRDSDKLLNPFSFMQYFSRSFNCSNDSAPILCVINEKDIRTRGGTARLMFESSLSDKVRGELAMLELGLQHSINYPLLESWLISIKNNTPLLMENGNRIKNLRGGDFKYV